MRLGGLALRCNVNLVLDLGDPRRGPRGTFGLFFLSPRPDAAVQFDRRPVHVDGNAAGIDLGAALQRFFDFVLDLGRRDFRFQLYIVRDPEDTFSASSQRIQQGFS